MGFLDKKKRIIDTYLTPYGRKKIAEGNLGISFVAATDISSMYMSDSNNTIDPDFIEICNETHSSYLDQMFLTTNDIGKYKTSNFNKNIQYITSDYTVDSDGKIRYLVDNFTVTSSDYTSAIGEISNESFKKFKNKSYIKNKQDNIFNEFKLDKNLINFYISNNSPIPKNVVKEIDIDTAEPLFFDKYVGAFDNFKFLPPVLPAGQGQTETVQVGNYTDLNQEDINTFEDIQKMLSGVQMHEIKFEKTSRDSNVVFQIMQTKDNSQEPKVIKLDTIDFGEFSENGKFKKVIFAGKTFIDNYDYPTYINFFTIILEE